MKNGNFWSYWDWFLQNSKLAGRRFAAVTTRCLLLPNTKEDCHLPPSLTLHCVCFYSKNCFSAFMSLSKVGKQKPDQESWMIFISLGHFPCLCYLTCATGTWVCSSRTKRCQKNFKKWISASGNLLEWGLNLTTLGPGSGRNSESKRLISVNNLGTFRKWQKAHVTGGGERERAGRGVWRAGSGLLSPGKELGFYSKWLDMCSARQPQRLQRLLNDTWLLVLVDGGRLE